MKPATNDLTIALQQLDHLSYMRETTREQRISIHKMEQRICRALYWITRDDPEEAEEVNIFLLAKLSDRVAKQVNGKR